MSCETFRPSKKYLPGFLVRVDASWMRCRKRQAPVSQGYDRRKPQKILGFWCYARIDL